MKEAHLGIFAIQYPCFSLKLESKGFDLFIIQVSHAVYLSGNSEFVTQESVNLTDFYADHTDCLCRIRLL